MATQPNVIVFFTDQQRWDTCGVHGNPLDITPNLDRVAKQGTHVVNSFSCQPVCGPARSCLQTGMYATNTGSYTNNIPLNPDLTTLADCFNGAGYDTGYIGKWHLAKDRHGPVAEADRGGYQYWLASNILEFTSNAYNTYLFDNDEQTVKLPGYRVDALTDAAIRYIDQARENPFFLFLSYIEPHFQNHTDDYPAPTGYRERYQSRWIPPDLMALGGSTHQHIAGYYGMCKRLDEAYGRLLDCLLSKQLLDNTIVLFTSDHGCHFKTRNNEYKRSCHESSIRVPTVLTGPGFTGRGEVTEMVSLVDLPPTLLDAAGLDIPMQMEGRSLLPLLDGDCDDWPEEAFVQISEAEVGRCIRTQRWKYSVVARDKHPTRDSGSDQYEEAYLYDLSSDPYELCNLVTSAAHAGICDQLRERLVARMVAAGEAAPTITSPELKRSGKHAGPALNDPFESVLEYPSNNPVGN